MCLTCLSNKNSPAPVVYLGLHTSLVAALVITCPAIIDFNQHPQVFLFWLDTAMTLFLYFFTHLRDPGYVEQDSLYFTEQQLPARHKEIQVNRRNDSLSRVKKKGKSPIDKTQKKSLTTNLEMKERIAEINKNYMKSIRAADPGTNSVSTHSVIVTNLATESVPPSEQKIAMDRPSVDCSQVDPQGINYPGDGSGSVIKREGNNEEIMVDCEPSMDVGDESLHHHHVLNFNAKSNDDIDGSGEIPERAVIASADLSQVVLGESRQDETGVKGERSKEESYDQDKTAELKNEQQNMHKNLTKHRFEDKFLNHPGQDQETDSRIKTKKGKYYQFNDESGTEIQDKGAVRKTDFTTGDLLSPVHRHLDPNQEYELMKSTERRLISRTDTEEAYVDKGKKKTKKKSKTKDETKRSTKDQNREIIIAGKKLDDEPEMEDLEKQQEEREEEFLYVERRYCTTCGLEQPIRAKHCKDCERCVSQYDHHCPWLGNCIGERNHLLFYWFLVFQLIEITWGSYKVLEYMFTKDYQDWASENAGRIGLIMVLGFFTIMICSLLCFHTYLAMANLTTWESLSWYKISYLKEWHEDWGSPFSEGTFKNLKFFCCSSKNELKKWEMPKYKRSLEEQESGPLDGNMP